MPLAVLLGDQRYFSIYQQANIHDIYTKDTLSATAAQITFDIMNARNGYKRLPLIGQHICDTFNSAAEAAQLSEIVKAYPLLDGSLFDIRYTPKKLTQMHYRQQLKKALFKQRILIHDTSCSFVNLAHEYMDFGILAERFYRGLCDWGNFL